MEMSLRYFRPLTPPINRLLAVFCVVLLAGCWPLPPLPKATDLDDRLAVFPTTGLPLDGEVTVHWNEHQVPFVVAESDEDAAFVLGLVHAHLRLGQIEMARRIVQGRISEGAGPETKDIDHMLRIIGFDRAAPEIVKSMSPESRAWAQRFVDGLNHYQSTMDEKALRGEGA